MLVSLAEVSAQPGFVKLVLFTWLRDTQRNLSVASKYAAYYTANMHNGIQALHSWDLNREPLANSQI